MMRIVPTNLSFGPLFRRDTTRRIIVHHSASPDVSAAVIHGWHLARGWSGIGYHFVVRADGTIEAGRPMDMIGAHAGAGANHGSIGICLTGDFTQHSPTNEQLLALVNLVDHLEITYGTMLEVLRHCDVAATLCPGPYFPWPENNWPLGSARTHENYPDDASVPWKKSLVKAAVANNLINDLHHPDDPAPKWFVLAVGLNIMRGMKNHEA